jgi:hypothetical protein
MIGYPTNKTMFSCEAKVSIGTSQTRQSIEGHTVYSSHNGQQEQRFMEELKRVGGMRHGGMS